MTNLADFYRYELVRRSGKYNMIMEAKAAAKAANLDLLIYCQVIRNYEQLKRVAESKYGSIDNFMGAYAG